MRNSKGSLWDRWEIGEAPPNVSITCAAGRVDDRDGVGGADSVQSCAQVTGRASGVSVHGVVRAQFRALKLQKSVDFVVYLCYTTA